MLCYNTLAYLERIGRIELPSERWQRPALPLSYIRMVVIPVGLEPDTGALKVRNPDL